MVDEVDTAAIVEEEQFENDHTDHFDLTEKQVFDQRLPKMESLVRVTVHDNTNLRDCLKGLVPNKGFVNVAINMLRLLLKRRRSL